MKNFYETILDIFKTITSKENVKPDLYLYETRTLEDQFNGNWNEVWEDHVCYTDLDEMDDAKSVYETYGADFRNDDADEKRHFTATRTELFKITADMTKENFDCDSEDEFYDQIPFERIYKNDADEEFFKDGGLYLVFSDGDFFVGLGKEELEEFVIMPEEDDDEDDNED